MSEGLKIGIEVASVFLDELRPKWANVFFSPKKKKKKQCSAPFPKLIRKMPLFYNLIMAKSSFVKNSII